MIAVCSTACRILSNYIIIDVDNVRYPVQSNY